jgi:hypothetical protein
MSKYMAGALGRPYDPVKSFSVSASEMFSSPLRRADSRRQSRSGRSWSERLPGTADAFSQISLSNPTPKRGGRLRAVGCGKVREPAAAPAALWLANARKPAPVTAGYEGAGPNRHGSSATIRE